MWLQLTPLLVVAALFLLVWTSQQGRRPVAVSHPTPDSLGTTDDIDAIDYYWRPG